MSEVVAALKGALPPGRVRVGDEIPVRNRADMAGLDPMPPMALVMPRSTEEVSAALKVCHAHRQGVVMQGGLTGLAGGGHPVGDEIALSLEAMSGIEEVDTVSGTLIALAGTPLQTIQAAAAEAGLLCAIDLGARGSCTIGGNVSTNAGGNQVLRYGMTRRSVTGLEVVLADGRIVRSLNKMMKNNAGYDWTQLFIGSEGTLGVVTRVVLALQPQPQGLETALASLPDFASVVRLLHGLQRRLPGGLLVFEAMWANFMSVATDRLGLRTPFAAAPPITVLLEVAAGEDGRERFEAALAAEMESGTVGDVLVARSQADRDRFWGYRESVYEYARIFPKTVGFDISLPIDRIAEGVAKLDREIPGKVPGSVHVIFGHVADSNLHVNVAHAKLDETMKRTIEGVVYGEVARLAGSVSAEHGIGRTKRPYLALSRSEPELALMATIKRALDPDGILNPGRVL